MISTVEIYTRLVVDLLVFSRSTMVSIIVLSGLAHYKTAVVTITNWTRNCHLGIVTHTETEIYLILVACAWSWG